ncbi:hypothetical protein [Candidatus Palauibacter sp.]|uniref:hypothetical protein n=1 Tax=Candidatus Palauibacter sp. TaxID=3101350 RepID=UPI003B02BA28
MLSVLDGDKKTELTWRAMCVQTRALLVQRNLSAAMDVFRSLYDEFVPGDETMMREALELVPELIAVGASAHDLVKTLSNDSAKALTLTPLPASRDGLTGAFGISSGRIDRTLPTPSCQLAREGHPRSPADARRRWLADSRSNSLPPAKQSNRQAGGPLMEC